jgi:hypothetical protein
MSFFIHWVVARPIPVNFWGHFYDVAQTTIRRFSQILLPYKQNMKVQDLKYPLVFLATGKLLESET